MAMVHTKRPAAVGQAYAVLRHGGASQERARAELRLTPERADVLEAVFQVRPPGPAQDAMRPRFARHELHVAAVRAAGGFPALACGARR